MKQDRPPGGDRPIRPPTSSNVGQVPVPEGQIVAEHRRDIGTSHPAGLWRRLLPVFALASCWFVAASAAPTVPAEPPAVQGLDHIVIAVGDLDAAIATYQGLGFTVKPGRPHANGIRNAHVKFAGGDELELLTVDEPRDQLALEYQALLAKGDGPVFVALHAPDLAEVERILQAHGRACLSGPGYLSLPADSPAHVVFFGGLNHSPTDRPEHFVHANGASALASVWLAGDDLTAERELLLELGVSIEAGDQASLGEVAAMPHGEVRLLPGSQQILPGRPLVGASLRTGSLANLEQALQRLAVPDSAIVRAADGSSIELSPRLTHGIRLRFIAGDKPR